MDEERKRSWEVRLGIVAPLLTMIGILIGVWQFNTGEEHRRVENAESALYKDEIEFRRRLWLERLEAYKSASEIAGTIIATPPGPDRDKASRDFLRAYWGSMVLFQDRSVEDAMVNFYSELLDQQSGWSTDPNRLKIRGEELISACRASLQAGDPRTLMRSTRS